MTSAAPQPDTDPAAVLDAFYGALTAGDVDAARACVTDDLVVWHSFDQHEEDLDTAVKGWHGLVAGFPERRFVDVRRAPVPGGWVQRQAFLATSASGERMGWPVCLFFTVRDGRIARIDEYIDRAGRFVPEADAATTPGLPPAGTGAL